MKILLDARLYGLENAGLGRYVMNLVQNLARLDRRNNYTILLRKKYFNRINLPPKWQKVETDFRHYSLAEQFRLPGVIREMKPDIVHFPHFNVPLFYSGRFVVTIHDILMHKQKGLDATTLNPLAYIVKRLAYKTVFRHAVRKAARVLVPSKFVKKQLADYYRLNSDRLIVTYEGFDEKVTPLGNPARTLKSYGLDAPYFIYTGNAYPHKNLKRLVEAIVMLNQRSDRRIYLAIASARDFFVKKMEHLAAKLGAKEYIKILGFVPDADLGVLYKNSVAFIFPSLSEGFGLTGLEAMSCGTLVLASEIPVFKEIYGPHALYFNPYDFTSIEGVARDALKMEEGVRSELIAKAKEYAKKYSWDKMARQTLKVYEDSIGLRSG